MAKMASLDAENTTVEVTPALATTDCSTCTGYCQTCGATKE